MALMGVNAGLVVPHRVWIASRVATRMTLNKKVRARSVYTASLGARNFGLGVVSVFVCAVILTRLDPLIVIMKYVVGVLDVPVGFDKVRCGREVVKKAAKATVSSAVVAQAYAGPSAVTTGIVSSGLRFTHGDRHARANIVPRESVVDVMAMDGGHVVGWPFSEPRWCRCFMLSVWAFLTFHR